MPTRSTPRRSALVPGLVLGLALGLSACADLGAVRDFGRSAAAVSAYPQAATAYVDSARTSAAFVAGSPQSFVSRSQREAQVEDALALHAALGDYFATLARLAGDDDFSLAKMKATASNTRKVVGGSFDRSTIDAYANLSRTLTGFAESPARERAVLALVQEGGPSAMQILASLRRVSADWRAQVSNDARQVDDTLVVAAMPGDVPPLLRILANDRQAELSRSYAQQLRKMRAADTALAAVETAHAALVAQLDDLSGPVVRLQLRRAASELQAAAVHLGDPP